MNKLFIGTTLLLALNACNSKGDKHAVHNGHDTAQHMDHATTNETSEMKALMDGMMTRMHQQKPTGNNDIDYANMMLQHHQAAIDMANLQLSKGKNDSLKNFYRQVIAAQQKEIAFMAEFISRSNTARSNNAAEFKTAMDASMQSMMNAATPAYNDIDKDFVAQMIPHHQSAVDMAKAYLKYGTNEGLVKMSNDIISSQSEEINWLKKR